MPPFQRQVVQEILSRSLHCLHGAECAFERSIRGYDHRRLPFLFNGRMVASFQIPRTTPLEEISLKMGGSSALAIECSEKGWRDIMRTTTYHRLFVPHKGTWALSSPPMTVRLPICSQESPSESMLPVHRIGAAYTLKSVANFPRESWLWCISTEEWRPAQLFGITGCFGWLFALVRMVVRRLVRSYQRKSRSRCVALLSSTHKFTTWSNLTLLRPNLLKKSINVFPPQLYTPHLKTSRSNRPDNLRIKHFFRRSLDLLSCVAVATTNFIQTARLHCKT